MFSFLKSSFKKIKDALSKTRSIFGDKIKKIFKGPLNEESLEELEKILFEADLGSALVCHFIDHMEKFCKKSKNPSSEDMISEMKSLALDILKEGNTELDFSHQPSVILIVGVNGSGKTTTCAKLAHLLKDEGKKVLLVAGDTFRAAAIDQLEIWAKRLSIDIVRSSPGSDPSAVLFDGLSAAKARGCDIVIADTAGRLQSKTDLMHELAKMRKVCQKVVPHSPHETLLVLDATTGQNAIDQAKIFHEFTPLSGLILTKLDGSAKGGIVLSIHHHMKLPIKFIGVGEGSDDFMPFNPTDYTNALFS